MKYVDIIHHILLLLMYRITKCLIFIIFISSIILVGKQIVLCNVKIYKMERRWRQFSLSSYKRIFLPCCDTMFATIMIYVASKLHNEVIKIYKLSKDMICIAMCKNSHIQFINILM